MTTVVHKKKVITLSCGGCGRAIVMFSHKPRPERCPCGSADLKQIHPKDKENTDDPRAKVLRKG